MALTSPGVEVKVIDESFYTPAEPGTVPLIIVASAENKPNGAGDGIAPGTLKANAGTVYLITSQKDLADTFGDPVFKTDVNNNPVHGGEQNEYGLQAAYSLLGVSNRAFVVRADVDTEQLTASVDAPQGDPKNGTYWLDTQISKFGIFEWDGRTVVNGGQKFVNKVPIIVDDSTKIDPLTGGPSPTIGKNGSYAMVTVTDEATLPSLTTEHPMTLWYRNSIGNWVQVGSSDWLASYPDTPLLAIQPHTNVPQWKASVLDAPSGSVWIKTTEPNLGARWRLSRYNSNTNLFNAVDAPIFSSALNALYTLDKTGGGRNLAVGTTFIKYNYNEVTPTVVDFKIYRKRAAAPTIIKSSKITASSFAGSPGILTAVGTISGTSIVGANTYTVIDIDTVTGGGAGAQATVTKTGVGTTYTSVNTVITITAAGTGYQVGDQLKILGTELGGTTPANDLTFVVTGEATTYNFQMAESVVGQSTLAVNKTITFTTTPAATDANAVASAINVAGFTNVIAEVDSQNRVVITHELGGEIHFTDGLGDPLVSLGFSAFDPITGNGLLNLYDDMDGTHDFVASLWEPLAYVAATDPPGTLAEDGQLWYSSVVDEVDLLIHNGNTWVGYTTEVVDADAAGPFVSASAPELQRDGTDLETGDIWISTDDIENFPTIYKYNKDLLKWILVDKSDQSTEDGILFADARYSASGENSDEMALIEDLLSSIYLDPDAPDPALYPKGMLLWNLRRSGFNVKVFKQNYIDVTQDNPRQGDVSMADYYPHRWVTISGNQEDGSGTFGRKAQRKVVVQSLQAMVNSNDAIRDEEGRIFNLIACPGYPELIGEMINLNFDRGLTAFVVGDSPARLTSDATSLLRWGNNQQLAVEDNDSGAASFDEYMAMWYPWGFTSDNAGNNVVVPPSHMMLRVIALNDQVAYPWFAPAGLRRGGISNATAVGYVDAAEGEFRTVALNTGQRDTLYEAKINPITFFTGSGLVAYGQKTRARAASALDRINVARLVIYLRSQLNKLAKPYIFEPNDKITRDEIKGAVESLLLELVGLRALYDYLVVCDESNNTPARIDRNELWIDIAIEPVKAVEFIYIPLRIKNTGEIAGL